MGPVPTQHHDTLGELRLVAKSSYANQPHRANHTIPPFWLDNRPPLLRHMAMRPAAGWSVLALPFKEPGVPLPPLHKPAIGPYPQQDYFSVYNHIPPPSNPFTSRPP
ncbi:hypothetical protein ANN_10740 [Periplaneta americana]|uniref:Uncharacterized protein n=1 Tax=Periplaneta americana TaxID=6978 RepID=A0ABQ8T357_PERAM|nr:hypothetical protein ANN_10740 [Periplaneta americana]